MLRETAWPYLQTRRRNSKPPRRSSRKTNPRRRYRLEELEALVAPIALYPDPLLIQVLAASTYPLEIVQLKQWMDENKKLKGKGLAEAVVQQNWDPSVQALAAFPVVVNKLANKIQWTTDLGNVFLAQQSDVMDAVQRLRAKAQANGALKTNDKQKVATETTDHGEQAITIEPAQQDVVYVPTYNTQVVYGDSDCSRFRLFSAIQAIQIIRAIQTLLQAILMMVTRTSAMLLLRPVVTRGGITIGATVMLR